MADDKKQNLTDMAAECMHLSEELHGYTAQRSYLHKLASGMESSEPTITLSDPTPGGPSLKLSAITLPREEAEFLYAILLGQKQKDIVNLWVELHNITTAAVQLIAEMHEQAQQAHQAGQVDTESEEEVIEEEVTSTIKFPVKKEDPHKAV